ncbi:hypothetical protein LTR36_009072 [Oleoguttula mirabilis]|uniref:SUZ domain-containing protein n=1 Tax=Oleoguttula mirabilis TaxID=1507867 RepID=A0AAV9J6E3_9PEZI|nr:hypothetical protein LTR36_009072 [Oleoguttula mirabilis]
MSKKGAVPDAWDDDWVNAADVHHAVETLDDSSHTDYVMQKPEAKTPEPAPKLTKSERKAQHQELQKQLWDTAENPGRNHWLETQGVVPMKQELKPQVTLLSRKPAPKLAKRTDPANGIAGLSIEDEGDDSEEEARKKRETDFEQRQKQAKLDREEKQRKYAEARERIMGSSGPGSPAAAASRESSQGRDAARKPRPKGTGNGSSKMSRPTSADQSPAPMAAPGSLMFDPDDMGRRIPKPSTPTLGGPTRQPRGPDASGRDGFGFGFAGRGGGAPV